MLAIRFQRVGRKGHAEFRVIVQEARRSPSSGQIVTQIGHYNPHTKTTVLDKEKAAFYVKNGAQPSPRVTVLLQKEGVKLPSWVKVDTSKAHAIKNSDKLRRNRPAEEVVAKEPVAETPVAEEPAVVEEAIAEAPVVEETAETAEPVVADEETVAEAPVAEEALTETAT